MDHDEKKKEVSREQLLQYVKKLKAENAELKKKSARLSSSTFWSHLDEQPPRDPAGRLLVGFIPWNLDEQPPQDPPAGRLLV